MKYKNKDKQQNLAKLFEANLWIQDDETNYSHAKKQEEATTGLEQEFWTRQKKTLSHTQNLHTKYKRKVLNGEYEIWIGDYKLFNLFKEGVVSYDEFLLLRDRFAYLAGVEKRDTRALYPKGWTVQQKMQALRQKRKNEKIANGTHRGRGRPKKI